VLQPGSQHRLLLLHPLLTLAVATLRPEQGNTHPEQDADHKENTSPPYRPAATHYFKTLHFDPLMVWIIISVNL